MFRWGSKTLNILADKGFGPCFVLLREFHLANTCISDFAYMITTYNKIIDGCHCNTKIDFELASRVVGLMVIGSLLRFLEVEVLSLNLAMEST